MGWKDAPVVSSPAAQPSWAAAPVVDASPLTPAQQAVATQSPSFAQQLGNVVMSPTGSALSALGNMVPAGRMRDLITAPVGGGELLAKLVTGGVASIPAGVAYGGAAIGKALGADVNPAGVQRDVQNYLTYKPVSDSAKAGAQAAATLARPVIAPVVNAADRAATAVGRVSPVAEAMIREAPAAFQAASAVFPVAQAAPSLARGAVDLAQETRGAIRDFRAPPPAAEDVLANMAAQSQGNMGAAAAAPSLQQVSPELRQAISQTAQKTGGVVNPEVLARHIEADTLPVPVRLTEGWATQDPTIISQEMNTRGSSKVMVEHLNDTNKRLAQNIQVLRDEVGPNVFSTNAVEHGDTLISAYKSKAAAADAIIDAKYKALRDASVGGQFPVDAKALLDNASQKLHQDLLFDHAPKAVMSTLERLASKDSMTFENFESLRTNLARIQRSLTADGNEKAAAAVIRGEMENLPLSPWAQSLKPLADDARTAARAQFRALEADPAYKAAVNDAVAPDRFVNRFVINAPRDEVALMRQNLAGNDAATQTMGVAALDHLRDAARLNPNYEGNFAAAGFNKGLQSLSPKLQSLLPPQTIEQLDKLGNVARYTTAQPKGSFVNNSNTAVAQAADYGAKVAEHAVNAKAGGLPVGTLGRKAIESMTRNRAARQSIAPGAGLGRLQSTSPQVQQMLDAARRRAAQ